MGSDNGGKKASGKTTDAEIKAQGLPETEAISFVGSMVPFIFVGVFALISFGIGLAILKYSSAKAEERIRALVDAEQHYVYAGAFSVGVTVRFINMFPTMFKSAIMRFGSGNLRSNPFVYKAIGEGSAPQHVVFDNEGFYGKYNRGNRSLHHMIETFGVVLLGLPMAGSVFPFPTFCAAIAFCLGRVMHQVGYSTGYGAHGLGFLISSLGTVAIEGMLLIVALKGFGVLPMEALPAVVAVARAAADLPQEELNVSELLEETSAAAPA